MLNNSWDRLLYYLSKFSEFITIHTEIFVLVLFLTLIGLYIFIAGIFYNKNKINSKRIVKRKTDSSPNNSYGDKWSRNPNIYNGVELSLYNDDEPNDT
jgi:hypothetical protein